MVAASDRDGVAFALSAGNCGDAPEGRALLRQLGPVDPPVHLLMDRAYEGDETRALALELGYIPVVPQYRPYILFDCSISLHSPILWCKYNMVLISPFCMH